MSATAWAWLVLLFPLLGSIVVGLGFRALPARVAGVIGTVAIGVMVVAACEVVVGLGLIVAIFRRKLPLDVDDLRELRG